MQDTNTEVIQNTGGPVFKSATSSELLVERDKQTYQSWSGVNG